MNNRFFSKKSRETFMFPFWNKFFVIPRFVTGYFVSREGPAFRFETAGDKERRLIRKENR